MNIFKEFISFVSDVHDINKEFVSDVRKIGKEFKNDMKDVVKESNPTLGNVIEKADRFGQTLGNARESLERNSPTTVPNTRDIIKKVIKDLELEKADHLKVQRIGYTHHGLYLGNNQVVHYQGGEVRISSLDDFKKNCEIRVVDSVALYSKDEIIHRAFSRIGEKEYNLVFNNCEHFANWCRSGSTITDSI